MLNCTYSFLIDKPLTKFMVVWFIMLQFPLGMFVDAEVAQSYVAGLEQPFICQGGNCGCQTAEQCWTKCCCTTHAERVAWANKHGYAIPEYAKRPALVALEVKSVKKSCCAQKSSCCKKAQGCCDQETKVTTSKKKEKSRHLVWSDVQRCQGKVSSWTLLGSVICDIPAKLTIMLEANQESYSLLDECCEVSNTLPELPPPKLIAG